MMRTERKLGGFSPRISVREGTVLLASCCFLVDHVAGFQLAGLRGPLHREHGTLSRFQPHSASPNRRPLPFLSSFSNSRFARIGQTSIADSASIDAFDAGSQKNSTIDVVVRKEATELDDARIEVKHTPTVLEPDADGKIRLDALRLSNEEHLGSWGRRIRKAVPSIDKLDKRIFLLTVPAVVNGLLLPIVGLIDAFYVAKLGDPLAFAAQGAANQVFSSTLGVLSFLPTVITPLVAAAHASGKTEKVQKHVGEGMFLSVLVGFVGMCILLPMPHLALSLVLPAASMAYPMAVQYFNFRVLGFIPSLVSNVGFSSLRGTMDTVRPMQVSLFVTVIRVILQPALMFGAALGVAGAGLSTMLCEVLSAAIFVRLLLTSKLATWASIIKVPSLSSLRFLGASGLVLQLRALALNAVFMKGVAAANHLDLAGTAAAAHVLTQQVFSVGATILFALSTVATVLASTGMAKFRECARGEAEGDVGEALETARQQADRCLVWGLGLGSVLGVLLLGSMPVLHMLSPMPAVVEAARPAILVGTGMMFLCGISFIGEGIMQGQKAFKELTVVTLTASAGMLAVMEVCKGSLAGIWFAFVVFNLIRSVMVLLFHFCLGPLSPRGRRRELEAAAAFKAAAAAPS